MTDENPKLKHQRKGGPAPQLVQTNVSNQSKTTPSKLTIAVKHQFSLDEMARYIIGYLRHKGIVITQRTPLLNSIGLTIDEADKAKVSEITTHGGYFTRIGLDLFVYLDESYASIGRDLFMEESNLFGPESAWSMSRRMAIFKVDDETSLDRIEKTLSEKGFMSKHATREALENGFKTGDTSALIKGRTVQPKT
ncbi:MAG: hypothetical protein NWE88_07790 [Candidatus Bathyarchaeota archaeon]|nr:hypothetical protein [Candidatus Bathyarchaeota archaeon]